MAGCGHASSPPRQSAPKPAPGPGSPRSSAPPASAGPRDPEPHGHLSLAEYRSIEREYTLLHPLTVGHGRARPQRRAAVACAALARPNTRLVDVVRQDCHEAVGFFSALAKLDSAGKECTRGPRGSLAGCVARRYADLALQLRLEVQNGLALNAELQRRGITGLCADSIGIRLTDLAAIKSAAVAAADAANAAAAGAGNAFDSAERRVADALASESGADPLVGIRRACRPPRAPAPPKARRAPRRRVPSIPEGRIKA